MARISGSSSTDWINKQFRESLQALAMPADIQVKLFSEGANIISELLADVICWSESYVINEAEHLPPILRGKIEEIIAIARRLYGISIENKWDLERLSFDGEWQQARDMAISLLCSLGWPVERPGPR